MDIATKIWAMRALWPPHVPHPVVGALVQFTLTFNQGAALGTHVGPASRVVFSALAVAVIALLVRFYRHTEPGDRLRALALGLLIGGAVGNLIDRIRWDRGVVDFIDIGTSAWRFWTFNVADAAVTCGAVLFAFVLSGEDRRRAQAERRRARESGS